MQPRSELAEIRSMDAIEPALERFEAQLATTSCELLPSSFDPGSPTLRAYPRQVGWAWTSLEAALRRFKAEGVMMRLPLSMQLELPLFRACRAAGSFIFQSDLGNIPLAKAALEGAAIDLVITTAHDAGALALYLRENGAREPRAWVVVRDISEHPAPLPLLSEVHEEIHLFPGMCVFATCTEAPERAVFHLSEEFLTDERDDSFRISSKSGSHLVPFSGLTIPLTVQKENPCRCGRDSFLVS